MGQEEDLSPLIKRSSTEDIELVSREREIETQATAHAERQKPESKLSGWKFSLTIGALTTFLVLLANLVVTIWAATREQFETSYNGKTGLRILDEGSCTDTKRTNTIIHLVINVLSTVLLGASNYCMQCLSAPTREDAQRAHSKGRWVDIGVPSIHNLVKIPRIRVLLWSLLVLSSVPLHLLYNSAVFVSLSTVQYQVYTIADWSSGNDSLFNRTWDQLNSTKTFKDIYYNKIPGNSTIFGGKYSYGLDDGTWYYYTQLPDVFEDVWDLARQGVKEGQLEKLTPEECISAYATAFQTSRKSLITVTEPNSNSTLEGLPILKANSLFESTNHGDQCVVNVYEWICSTSGCRSDTCRNKLSNVKKNADDWKPFDSPRVKYCLSEPVEQYCKLYFSTSVMAFVIVANFIKVCVILYTAYHPPKELLLVLGDAVESFLKVPDATSVDSCLVSSDHIKRNIMNWTGPRLWYPLKKRLGSAVTRRRWAASLALYSISFIVSVSLLAWGIRVLAGPHDASSLWELGIGTATEAAIISFSGLDGSAPSTIVWSILIANVPQLFFSFLYFQYNGLFTCMLAAKEWSDFGRKRRGLRVAADPVGAQRSRYFLQLPYRWGIPLILMSILLHWLLSQSLFVVAIETDTESIGFGTSYNSRNPERELYMTCGYSPAAIILVLVTSGFMVFGVVGTGFMSLPTAIPMVGSCSLAIAAACHHPSGVPQPEAPLHPLKWGVIQKSSQGPKGKIPGHCGFSMDHVDEPEAGEEYS